MIIRRTLAFVISLALLLLPMQGYASQGSLIMPTSGTLSGLTLVNDINAALDALVTCNSGGTAPLNSTGAPSVGQFWCSTATSGYLILEQYDGTSWQEIGRLDTTNHLWVPPVGGGTGTIASATTTDLGSVPQSYMTVSGTTTITGFGSSAPAGTWKSIKFTGILTLTHNATSLILPNNGNNITTAAGDTALAVALGGGSWLVANYTQASGNALQAQSVGSAALLASAQGMNAPLNLRINASVAGSALTVAIKTAANADATSGTPILIPFRDATITNGDPVIGSLQAALSFTVASTNTMGAQNGVPFRLWVIAYYNGGTLAVGLFNASSFSASGGTIYPLAEGGIVNTAASTNGGSSAGTHYANVSTITNTPYRILGYLEWSSGLATAGTWASGPTSIVLFGPGIKKPGDVVQVVYATTSTSISTTSATPVITNLAASISPTSKINPIIATAAGPIYSTSNTSAQLAAIYRNSASNLVSNIAEAYALGSAQTISMVGFDFPASTSPTSYAVYISTNAGTAKFPNGQGTDQPAALLVQEIMGALDEPVNDNGFMVQTLTG